MRTWHPALPPPVSRPWLLVAVAVWMMTAALGPPPVERVAPGPFRGDVILLRDVVAGRFGPWALGRASPGIVLVEFDEAPDAGRGDTLQLTGTLDGIAGEASGRGYGSVLDVTSVRGITPSGFLPHRAGRVIAERVEERLGPFDPPRALLSGFLIGETSRLDEPDIEAMRRSGLSHYVAVSGSNVALFLGLLAVVAGPLGWGPRRRALLGLIAIPVYVAATRFEPSVMRASVMAGLALGGKLVGIVLEAWQLIALAVVVLLLADPALANDAGFQLSVAATAGVLIGARWPAGGPGRRALLVTLGAQLAVAPLLLVHFGSVPLLSPLVNLVAGPIVAVSTVIGAVGVVGPAFLIGPAAWTAGLVLTLARGSAGWPQLELSHVAVLVGAVIVVIRFPRYRLVAALAGAGLLLVTILTPGRELAAGSVAVLDVGQGDAILLHGGEGHYALVDGGPDEAAIVTKLASYGVEHLELVVLTHVHADHATGLTGVVGRIPIARVWESTAPHATDASERLLEDIAAYGIPAQTPTVGTRWQLGMLEVVVEAPLRRYASPNDQSIVLTVQGPARSMLLAGDIETHAQEELDHLRADVLKVPHQGAATSDPGWLKGVGADVAVISVGPNDYGHPAGWVIDLFEAAGTAVHRTDSVGDVVIDLSWP
ncbi:MAG TPA: ComEC/Rec2 family competence protein [Acidimicrobiia bacterium]|nr:ComEC/Rec2 family competence protein [Acidimicrobiia bacterium]